MTAKCRSAVCVIPFPVHLCSPDNVGKPVYSLCLFDCTPVGYRVTADSRGTFKDCPVINLHSTRGGGVKSSWSTVMDVHRTVSRDPNNTSKGSDSVIGAIVLQKGTS